jgi:hypothetical protein
MKYLAKTLTVVLFIWAHSARADDELSGDLKIHFQQLFNLFKMHERNVIFTSVLTIKNKNRGNRIVFG